MFLSVVVVLFFFFFFFIIIYLFEWSTMRNVCFRFGGVDSLIWITYYKYFECKFPMKSKSATRSFFFSFFFFFRFILNNKMCVKNVWFPFHLVSDRRLFLILLHVFTFLFHYSSWSQACFAFIFSYSSTLSEWVLLMMRRHERLQIPIISFIFYFVFWTVSKL